MFFEFPYKSFKYYVLPQTKLDRYDTLWDFLYSKKAMFGGAHVDGVDGGSGAPGKILLDQTNCGR